MDAAGGAGQILQVKNVNDRFGMTYYGGWCHNHAVYVNNDRVFDKYNDGTSISDWLLKLAELNKVAPIYWTNCLASGRGSRDHLNDKTARHSVDAVRVMKSIT